MRNFLLFLVLALGINGVQADDWSSFYFNPAIGRSSTDASGYDGAAAASVDVGYRFNRFLGFGAGYYRFGESEGDSGRAIEAKGLYPSLSAYWPVNDAFDLYLRAGYFNSEVKITSASGSNTLDGGGIGWGVGGLVAVWNNLAVSAGYDNFEAEGVDISYGSIGLRISFY